MEASAHDSQEDTLEGTNKFYCYLCSITCHSQQVGAMHSLCNMDVHPSIVVSPYSQFGSDW
jgi:hypothetical protein